LGGLLESLAAAAFLKGYLAAMGPTPLLPKEEVEKEILLKVLVLERSISQAEQYISQTPEALIVPLTGILRTVDTWALPGGRDS